MKKLVITLFLLVSALTFGYSVYEPNTLIVSPYEGSNTNTGRAAALPVVLATNAMRTITAAVAAAQAGETIIILPGTYEEEPAAITIDKQLTIIGYGATLSQSATTDFGGLTVSASNCVFEGITVQTAADGIATISALNLTGSNNVFRNMSFINADTTSTSKYAVAISTGVNNQFENCRITSESAGGKALYQVNSAGYGNQFVGCYFSGASTSPTAAMNSSFNKCVFTSTYASTAAQSLCTSVNSSFENCSFYLASTKATTAAKTGVSTTFSLIRRCNFVLIASGSDTGTITVISATDDGVIVDSCAIQATQATGTPVWLTVTTGKTALIANMNIPAANIAGAGTVKYAPVDVLKSGGATPIAITDILKAGSYPIWTDSQGQVYNKFSGRYGGR